MPFFVCTDPERLECIRGPWVVGYYFAALLKPIVICDNCNCSCFFTDSWLGCPSILLIKAQCHVIDASASTLLLQRFCWNASAVAQLRAQPAAEPQQKQLRAASAAEASAAYSSQ